MNRRAQLCRRLFIAGLERNRTLHAWATGRDEKENGVGLPAQHPMLLEGYRSAQNEFDLVVTALVEIDSEIAKVQRKNVLVGMGLANGKNEGGRNGK